MRQLTALDAGFLNMETEKFSGHVGGLVLLDPSSTPSGTITADDVREMVRERLHLLEPYRWRLVQVPFDLDYPYWIDAGEFDLDFHVQELALPAPGTREQLAEQVARITARPLDRSRPLWELYVIQGVEGGLVGLQTKIHHAAVDGASGSEILGTLFDKQPKSEVPPPEKEWKAEPVPSDFELLGRALTTMATQPLQAMATLGRLGGTATDALPRPLGDADGNVLEQTTLKAPKTSFNAPITPHRRYAYCSIDLEDVKRVKNPLGLTVNDVVLALCTGALRRWLIDHNELPAEPLVAAVPVSVRPKGEKGSYGNQVSVMTAPLPTHEADPRKRLELISNEMKVAKERHGALPATLMQDMTQFMPPALAARAARVGTQLMAQMGDKMEVPFNLIISNVPGPQHPLYCAGARVVSHHVVSGVGDGSGLNISLFSLDGHLDFGLVACRELVPDLWNIADYLAEEMQVLLDAVGEKPSANAPAKPNAKAPAKPNAKAPATPNAKAPAKPRANRAKTVEPAG